jgi:hypothetical protein
VVDENGNDALILLLKHAKTTDTRLASVEAGLIGTTARLDGIDARLDGSDARLSETNVRLEALENRVSAGFATLTKRFDRFEERFVERELRLSTEISTLSGVTRELRDLLSEKIDDRIVLDHERRIRSLENKIADRRID